MLRTVEILIVILILAGAFIAASLFAVLPSPRQISSPNLRQLALTTLQVLDTDKALTETVFKDPSDRAWIDLQIALSACLPPNIVYNLTVYDIVTLPDGTVTYQPANSITNSESGVGTDSEAASYLVTSTNVTFTVAPQKISGTLYILNCNDANGWWITGYTAQSLASDLYNLLSPYFQTTVLVNSTYQLGLLLNGTALQGETLQNAVIINTFGEAVPIPAGYYATQGYYAPRDSYSLYCHILGQKTRNYNWTWVSIVGYPLYYVSNTGFLSNSRNNYGIYGMKDVGAAGLNAFLRGIDNQGYSYDGTWLTSEIGLVEFTSEARDLSNYYGIYPAPSQMASRALPVTGSKSIVNNYHLTRQATMFELKTVSGVQYCSAATFSHNGGGALTAIGLTRIPDIRVTALALLMYYRPTIYKSEFTLRTGERPTQRLVVLQLSQQGGS
ncbi:MAG: hypothetical protein ACUVRA_03120 [Candidatus Bathyarchaeaceae archaeon]